MKIKYSIILFAAFFAADIANAQIIKQAIIDLPENSWSESNTLGYYWNKTNSSIDFYFAGHHQGQFVTSSL